MTIAADFVREDPQIYTPSTPCKFSPSLPHTPSRSSPLSARPQTTISGMFKPKMLPSPPSSPPDFLVPKRLFKPVPIFTSHEKGRETRRDLFLKKVRSKREDKVMKSRGGEEEMMRLIFVSEQKRWEATQARAAATISTIYEEEELEFDETQGYDLPDQVDQSADSPNDDFDEIIEREGEELEALLSQLDLDFDHVMVEDSFKEQDPKSMTSASFMT